MHNVRSQENMTLVKCLFFNVGYDSMNTKQKSEATVEFQTTPTICAWCYPSLKGTLQAPLSHGICPECYKKQMDNFRKSRVK